MSISGLKNSALLFQEWNDFVNATVQMSAWAEIAITKKTALISDPNYALNASAQEIAFVTNFQNVINNFIGNSPINPDGVLTP